MKVPPPERATTSRRATRPRSDASSRSPTSSAAGERFELVYFTTAARVPNILICQGSGGHAYVVAELAYRMHLAGYKAFVMPRHGVVDARRTGLGPTTPATGPTVHYPIGVWGMHWSETREGRQP